MKETFAKPQDIITRYIYNRKEYSSNGVKYNTFIPPVPYPNELSVCVISGLSEGEIWGLSPPNRRDGLKARGDLVVSSVSEISDEQGGTLSVLIDGVPHPKHANIKNMPLEKSLQKVVAIELANKAALKVL